MRYAICQVSSVGESFLLYRSIAGVVMFVPSMCRHIGLGTLDVSEMQGELSAHGFEDYVDYTTIDLAHAAARDEWLVKG